MLAHYLFFPFYLGLISNVVQQLVVFGFFAGYAAIHIHQIKPLFSKLGQYKNYLIFAAVCYFLILVASFLMPILYGTNDFSYLSMHIRYVLFLFRFIVLLAMIRTHINPENLKDEILDMFTIATRNYVIFTMILLLIQPFRDFWISLIHETPNRLALLESPMYFARIGWAGYSGFSMTYFCTLSALFSLYLIVKAIDEKKAIPGKYLVSLLFALIGNSFYGRAGLLASLALIGFTVMYFVVAKKKFHYAVILIIGILGVFLFLSFLRQFNDTLASWYDWMMQPFMSLIESGTIQTSSTDTLWGMWFIPDPIMILFGNGFYTSPVTGNYYMQTDVGFLRPMLFFGLFFTIILFIIPTILTLVIGTRQRVNRLFAFMIIFTLFLFEIKAEVVQLLIPLMFMLYIAEFVSPIKNKLIKENASLDRTLFVDQPELT
jgi:hypothetical protein